MIISKSKFIVLKEPNPLRERVISFPAVLPKEFDLHRFVDHDMQFDKAFVEPLKAVIGLIPGAKKVTNLHFMEDLEGTQGAGRVNVTGLRDPKESVEEALEAMRKELHDAGVKCTEVEWSVAIDRALPRNRPVGNRPRGPELETGVFGAGDAFLAPSLEGAMRSGRKAAEAWVSWQREAQHSS